MAVECKYNSELWTLVGKIYHCKIQKSEIFDGSRLVIDSINGDHLANKTNENVQGIHMMSIQNVKFLPSNFATIFKNIKGISIRYSDLREITKTDLIPFPQLEYLNLDRNKIKVIRSDLLKFNPEIKAVWLNGNQILKVEHKVFDGLNHLEYLDLSNNECENLDALAETRPAVLKLIEVVNQNNCMWDEELLNKCQAMTKKIAKLEDNIEKLMIVAKYEQTRAEKLYEIVSVLTTFIESLGKDVSVKSSDE